MIKCGKYVSNIKKDWSKYVYFVFQIIQNKIERNNWKIC
jgi:hypothetical protein